jgi:hypothetical protein
MLDNSKALNKIAEESTANVGTLYSSLNQFSITSESVLSSSRLMKDKNFVVLAKIDHILFKADAFEHIQKDSHNNFSNHNECRFGKWYNTDGQSQFGHSKSFKEIITPHTLVHNAVLDTFALIENSNALEHEEAIKNNFINMEEASDRLFYLMDEMLLEESNYSNEGVHDGDIELWSDE